MVTCGADFTTPHQKLFELVKPPSAVSGAYGAMTSQ
jgi:hypothetical protein